MKKRKSLANNTTKKRKIIIGLLVGSVAVIALAIGLAVSLIKCNKNKENDLSDLSLKATTDANNQSNYGTLTYNEDLDISEISFNTYDNIELHIGLVHKINDNNLQ
ncbi:hypothetical protein FACS1894166_07080 [Bacilli bacterium]|nr:hypothetical protein FACS1894166_07080 [Bacilli bacterium]